MNNIKTVSVDLDGKTLQLETGRMANQASGSVTLRIGDTILLSAATASKEPRADCDFFPLQIEYREKFYAAGRFPGGFFKREARPSEKEILTARATDRPIRPLFPADYKNELQIFNVLLSCDGENEPDMLSINGASTALMLSEIPFMGPIGAVRVGRVNGEFIVNPTNTDLAESDLELVYVGTRDLPIMIEGSGKEVPEADMVAAMKFAHPFVEKIAEAQLELRRVMGLPDKVVNEESPIDQAKMQQARDFIGSEMDAALSIADKQERQNTIGAIKDRLKEHLLAQDEEMTNGMFNMIFDELEIEITRRNVLEKGKRIDGRAFNELRELTAEVGLLPRTHGSALFSRGETQALAAVTLGTGSDAQSMDAVTGGEDEKSFMLHYNFPPFCVGEVRRIGSTSRREIGHGALAERSLREVMPEEYPYTVRIVSEIMGSNGSSSMASICVGTLALMDAGIPIKKPVAGISVGLFSQGDQAELVTDILGAEDHCGDMDFKVAGTRDGITGFQVDLKIRGLKWELVEGAFKQAREARLQILDYMESVLDKPREDLSEYAPRIHVMKIDPEKIGALIGPGGKVIRRITETTGVQIDVEDDGTVKIFSTDKAGLDAAVAEVSGITAEAEVDKIYRGKVTGIKDFGAFVEILPGKDGLVHISELADFRVKNVEDICKIGDPMWVKCIGIDDRGKIKLSRKQALAEKDEE
ncbi:MAG: polyribonucleotide nucleotidyltransferase [Spartobacteria bacterium]|nr:polyribonucleotide nucleotidyltransferase [Spartobacteria bacterium]